MVGGKQESILGKWDENIPGTFLDGLLGVVLLVVAQPPQPAPFLGVVLQVGAQRPQPRWL